MKKLNSDRKKIFAQAHRLKKENENFSFSYCLKLAWAVYFLYVDMQGGNISEFQYRKKTGEIRKAFGTLASERKEPDSRYSNIFLYFDADKNNLRAFQIKNLII